MLEKATPGALTTAAAADAPVGAYASVGMCSMPAREVSEAAQRLLSDPSRFVFDDVNDAIVVAAQMIYFRERCLALTKIRIKDTSLTADNLRDGGCTKEEISISPLSTSTKGYPRIGQQMIS